MHKVRRAKKKKSTLVDKKYVCTETCRAFQKPQVNEFRYI